MASIQKLKHTLCSALMLLTLCLPVAASAQSKDADYVYFGFEPDIITNYISSGKKLGFVRVTVEVMIDGPSNLEQVEHHSPLLRASLVEIFGNQTEEQIKSLAGRETIRKLCFDTVNELLKKETGQPLAKELIFTKYLYE